MYSADEEEEEAAAESDSDDDLPLGAVAKMPTDAALAKQVCTDAYALHAALAGRRIITSPF